MMKKLDKEMWFHIVIVIIGMTGGIYVTYLLITL